jgi:hypothetical protein
MIVAGACGPDSMITCAGGCACRMARSVSMPSGRHQHVQQDQVRRRAGLQLVDECLPL